MGDLTHPVAIPETAPIRSTRQFIEKEIDPKDYKQVIDTQCCKRDDRTSSYSRQSACAARRNKSHCSPKGEHRNIEREEGSWGIVSQREEPGAQHVPRSEGDSDQKA